MRDISLFKHPVCEPGVCGKCGTQHADWFVDLGFDTVFNINPAYEGAPIWTDGVVYLCCNCYNSLVVDLNRLFLSFNQSTPQPNKTVAPVGFANKGDLGFLDRSEAYELWQTFVAGELEKFEEEDGNSRSSDDDNFGDTKGSDGGSDDNQPDPKEFGGQSSNPYESQLSVGFGSSGN